MADYKYDSPYSGSGSLTREQFLFHETRIVAKLLIDEGLNDNEIVERIMEENEIINCLNLIIEKRNELANKAMELNYKQLYESIAQLDETDACPVCGTPVSKAERNPYSYAKEKIEEYKEIDSIKQLIKDKSAECKTSIDELDLLFKANTELMDLLDKQPFHISIFLHKPQ